MSTWLKFRITPDKILSPEAPPMELYVKMKGWILTSYSWSCLPGYLLENEGAIEVSTLDGTHYQFYLNSRPFSAFDSADNPCYGILNYFDCGPCLSGAKSFRTKLFQRMESSEGAADGTPLRRPP
jgi:hypothetical protein